MQKVWPPNQARKFNDISVETICYGVCQLAARLSQEIHEDIPLWLVCFSDEPGHPFGQGSSLPPIILPIKVSSLTNTRQHVRTTVGAILLSVLPPVLFAETPS